MNTTTRWVGAGARIVFTDHLWRCLLPLPTTSSQPATGAVFHDNGDKIESDLNFAHPSRRRRRRVGQSQLIETSLFTMVVNKYFHLPHLQHLNSAHLKTLRGHIQMTTLTSSNSLSSSPSVHPLLFLLLVVVLCHRVVDGGHETRG